jgi:hypothetical protein
LNELLKREIYCYVFLLEIDSWIIAEGVGEDGERKVRKGKKEVGVIQGATWE